MIEIKHLSKNYGTLQVLKDVNATIHKGEVISIIGPSGTGKTMAAEAIASRLGKKIGCREQTFFGLAGIGDLIVTATSMHSRNNRCGILLGQGVSVEEATRQVGMVVEGLNALPAAMSLARKYNVEMPIVETVYSIVHKKIDVSEAIERLMSRDIKPE
jgi:glycerol-3-phosphate dehydrogenase